MRYKQGDLVWVNFPFSDDFSQTKKRPAIVVSNELSNSLDDDLLLVPITTALRNDDFSFLLEDSNTSKPLPQKSEVRCNKIITFRQSLIIGKFAELQPVALQQVLTKIILVFQ